LISFDPTQVVLSGLERSFAGLSYTVVPQEGLTISAVPAGHYELALATAVGQTPEFRIEVSRGGERLHSSWLVPTADQQH
jgi:hypothetical protein